MPKVSVIIPVYGVEEHIERCAISLFAQTLDDIEYIFVDDCTKDNSIGVLSNTLLHFPERKSQVKIITHSTNKGVAQARITGLQHSNGDYIIHCDSDDWVDSHMYELMYDMAVDKNCDMVVCDYMNVYHDHFVESSPSYDSDFLRMLLLCRCTGSLCNKLVKRKIILNNDFLFTKYSFSEDYVYSIQYAIYSSNIEYVPLPLYKYCHRSGSLVSSVDKASLDKRIQENLDNYSIVEYILREKNLFNQYQHELTFLKLKVKNYIRANIKNRGYYCLWIKTFPELTFDIFKSPFITWRSRFAYLATLLGLYSIKRH